MKKFLPVAATAVAALVLAGCSDSEPSESDPAVTDAAGSATAFGTEADIAILEAMTWEEDGDGVPTLTFDQPGVVSSTATRIVEPGDGEAVAEGHSITVGYTITAGLDGEVLYSTYAVDAPETLTVSAGGLDPVLYDAFVNSSVGADIIFATIDSTATDPNASSVFMALTIESSTIPLDRAEGAAVEPAEGLPTITLAENGVPSVAFDGAEKPSELIVQPLIEGEGDVVEEGDSITVHYTGWIWEGEQFDSSWDRGEPTTFALAQGALIDGWVQGLAGQPVGSQVLLVIPPELAYGENGNGSIPGGSTLVFVVDILAAA